MSLVSLALDAVERVLVVVSLIEEEEEEKRRPRWSSDSARLDGDGGGLGTEFCQQVP